MQNIFMYIFSVFLFCHEYGFYCRCNERNQLLVCNHLYIFLIPWDRLDHPYGIGVTGERLNRSETRLSSQWSRQLFVKFCKDQGLYY